eukprot:5502265-Amphidinium_carterae.1
MMVSSGIEWNLEDTSVVHVKTHKPTHPFEVTARGVQMKCVGSCGQTTVMSCLSLIYRVQRTANLRLN